VGALAMVASVEQEGWARVSVQGVRLVLGHACAG